MHPGKNAELRNVYLGKPTPSAQSQRTEASPWLCLSPEGKDLACVFVSTYRCIRGCEDACGDRGLDAAPAVAASAVDQQFCSSRKMQWHGKTVSIDCCVSRKAYCCMPFSLVTASCGKFRSPGLEQSSGDVQTHPGTPARKDRDLAVPYYSSATDPSTRWS